MFKLSRLAGRLLAAAALAAALLVPGMAYADDAVSFNRGDVVAGDQVYLGSCEGNPIAWDVKSASSGLLDVQAHHVLFSAIINSEASVYIAGNLTLETSDLYTETLPNFRNENFSNAERSVTEQFTLPGNFGEATTLSGTKKQYIYVKPLEKAGGLSGEEVWAFIIDNPDGSETRILVNEAGWVCPVSRFDLNPVLFLSDADGGKSGAAGAGDFAELSATSSVSAWKFTLLDSSRAVTAFATGTMAHERYSSWNVPVTFSGGGTGSNDYVSAILCDADGNAIYYGTVASATASGTQGMDMPAGLAEGTYTLKVFSEQRNGNQRTDYAGPFVNIELTVGPPLPEYTVKFMDEDGAEISTATYTEGTAAADVVKPADPTKPPTAQYTYEFAGWDPAVADVTGDATYTATYEATPVPKPAEKATLTFDLAGGTLDGKTGSITVEASVGDTVKLPAAPTREGYTFKYWKGSQYAAGADYKVEGDHSFTAVWEKNAMSDSGDSDKKSPLSATGDDSAAALTLCALMALASLALLSGSVVLRRRDAAYKGKHSAR